MKIGPSGEYPQGKLDETDKGELTMAVTRVDDVIRIDFGTSVEWIGMSTDEAIGLAMLLMRHAHVQVK
jgi:hypothetical protein